MRGSVLLLLLLLLLLLVIMSGALSFLAFADDADDDDDDNTEGEKKKPLVSVSADFLGEVSIIFITDCVLLLISITGTQQHGGAGSAAIATGRRLVWNVPVAVVSGLLSPVSSGCVCVAAAEDTATDD